MARGIVDQINFLRGQGHAKAAADLLQGIYTKYSVFSGQIPSHRLAEMIGFYNDLSLNKQRLRVTGNNLRNTVGVLFEDYLTSIVLECTQDYPALDTFNQVKTPFGYYALWEKGVLSNKQPSELSDIVSGYLLTDGKVTPVPGSWPKHIITKLEKNQSVMPLLLVSSKVRVSQPEFFDWLGRAQLMAKGHPHCLTIQVALRKEMDFSIVEVAQATEHWFLLGDGREGQVVPNQNGLDRLLKHIKDHFAARMG